LQIIILILQITNIIFLFLQIIILTLQITNIIFSILVNYHLDPSNYQHYYLDLSKLSVIILCSHKLLLDLSNYYLYISKLSVIILCPHKLSAIFFLFLQIIILTLQITILILRIINIIFFYSCKLLSWHFKIISNNFMFSQIIILTLRITNIIFSILTNYLDISKLSVIILCSHKLLFDPSNY
jgi:hypothetical protein